MKKIYSFALVAAMMATLSCAHEEFDDYGAEVTFSAVLDTEEATKAELGIGDNNKPQTMWTEGDKITIHNGVKSFEFATDIKGSAQSAEFKYKGNDFSAENGVISVYPTGNSTADLNGKKVSVNIPSKQTATAGSFDPEAAVAVAYSTDNQLSFKNVTSMLKFTVANTGVKRVIFEGINDEVVSGKTDVTFNGGSISTVRANTSATDKTVELTANETFAVGTTYYMNILPQNFTRGFRVYLSFSENGQMHQALEYTRSRNINRNVILDIGALSSRPDVNPVLSSFSFKVENNPGKILNKKLSYNTSSKVTLPSTVTEEVCTIDEENKTVKLYIPYLYDFKLIPTFVIPEGTTLSCNGNTIVSNETIVDFSTCRQITVTNGAGRSAVYDIELTNTGLPIVVINQETGTVSSTNDSEFKAASEAWWNATGAKWQLKESDWLKTDVSVDNFMIYYPDGRSALTDESKATVNAPVLSSTRERGNVTRQMPKKPFAVKLDKKHGIFINDKDDTNDLPAHKRWVLLANWKDRTLMRNHLAFEVAKAFRKTFPNDGIAWNPSGQFVELVYNGVHVGNYYLCEQVKIDDNRLNINDPYSEGDPYSALSAYGCLLESDDGYDETWKFMTKMSIPFLFKDDGCDAMLNDVQTFVRGIEDNLRNGNYDTAYERLDITSMVDFLLIQELMMNCELQHPKSMYSYINNGKLYAGPIWDFDWNTLAVTGNFERSMYAYEKSILEDASPRYYNPYISGSTKFPNVDGGDQSYMWYPLLVKNAKFTAKAAERWNSVQTALTSVSSNITQMAAKIRLSESCNYGMWQVDTKSENIRGDEYGISGGNVIYCGYCGDEGMSFDQAILTLQSNFNARISGMSYVKNQNWPSKSVTTVRR